MSTPSKRIRVYMDLIEHILLEQEDMVSLARLNLFLSKAQRKYPKLKGLTVNDDRKLELSDKFLEDEEAALKNMSTIIACTFKVLEMFIGSGNAKEMVLGSVDSYRGSHPELDEMDIKKYLPKRGVDSVEKKETVKDIEEIKEVSAEDILKPKDEGIPYYDETKKEWVLKPAHIVKKVKEEDADGVVPAFEDVALKRKKVFKKVVKKKGEEKKAEKMDWLQNDFGVGASYIVEGTGQEKNMLSTEFLKEGLEAGEEVIAIVGYSPKVLLAQLQKIGVTDNDLKKLNIIDWHTFKEKHVVEIESSGKSHIVPKDPKFMGSALTKILGSMDRNSRKRAFVSIVSYALAFIDFETVFNFVQITKLKFNRSNVTGLFTLEAGQHGKEIQGPLRELMDGWIRVKEGLSGANTWKMKAEIKLSTEKKVVKDVVIMRNGIVVLERKTGKAEKEGLEGLGIPSDIENIVAEAVEEEKGQSGIDSYLIDKMEMWKGLGFTVTELEEAMEDGEEAFRTELADFEKIAGRALETRGRLDEVGNKVRKLRDRDLEEEILELRKKIRDLVDLDKVEDAITALNERLKSKLAKETKRRDREKEIFRIRMEHWARQGYDTSSLEEIMDKDLETVNKEFAGFRAIVNRLKQMEEQLNKMDTLGYEQEEKAVRKRLFDVSGIEETLEQFNKLRETVSLKERIKETAETRRNELMDEVFNWALEGYCVDLMDQVNLFKEDLGTLEKRLGRIRTKVKRLKEAEETLNRLDLVRYRREEMEIRASIKDVEKVDEIERKVLGLQENVRGKISSDVMALDANIERVRELEDTWQKLKDRLLAESRIVRKRDDKEEEEG